MANKLQLDSLAQPVVNIYNEIEHNMLINIAENLDPKGIQDDALDWQLKKMEQLGLLNKKNLQVIKNRAKITSQEMNAVLLNAGLEGVQPNEKQMEKALQKGAHIIKPEPVVESNAIISILQAYQNQAIDTLNLTNQTLVNQAGKTYVDILNKSVAYALTGNLTGHQVIRKVIAEWSEKGIPALIDKGGKHWGPEGYVRMVAMTTSNNVVNEMQDQRMDEWGVDLTEISSHAGARPKCAPYQGRVFSLSRDNSKYPYIGSTSQGEPDGLFGINCGHMKYPYIEGFSEQTYKPYDEEENAKIYKESQKQRYYERSIRNAKTRVRMLEAAGDKEGAILAKELVSKRQSTMRKFIKRTGRKRRYDREQVYVGKKFTSKLKIESAKSLPKKKKQIKKKVEEPKLKPQNNEPLEDWQKAPEEKTNEKTLEQLDKEAAQFTEDLKQASKMFSNVYMSDKEMVEEYRKVMSNKAKEEAKKVEKKVQKAKALGDIKKPDVSKYKEIGDDYYDIDRRKDAMTIDELAPKAVDSIETYTGSSYRQINNYLRNNTDASERIKETAKMLRKTIKFNSHKLSKGIIFKRQIGKNAVSDIFGSNIDRLIKNASTDDDSLNELRKKLGNYTFSDKGFVSTTFNDTSFMGANTGIEVKIYAPKGFDGGMFVDSVSQFKSEGEYLLNAGTGFRIFDLDVSNGVLNLKVEPIKGEK